SAQGGGLYVDGGSLTIATSTISSNQGTGGSGLGGNPGITQGGGLYNGGTLTVSNSTLSGNTAPRRLPGSALERRALVGGHARGGRVHPLTHRVGAATACLAWSSLIGIATQIWEK